MGGGDRAGETGVVDDQVAVDAPCLAVGVLVEIGEDERRHGLARDAQACCLGDGVLDQRRDVEALVRCAADQDRVTAEAPVGVGDAREVGDVSTRADTGGPPAAW